MLPVICITVLNKIIYFNSHFLLDCVRLLIIADHSSVFCVNVHYFNSCTLLTQFKFYSTALVNLHKCFCILSICLICTCYFRGKFPACTFCFSIKISLLGRLEAPWPGSYHITCKRIKNNGITLLLFRTWFCPHCASTSWWSHLPDVTLNIDSSIFDIAIIYSSYQIQFSQLCLGSRALHTGQIGLVQSLISSY